MIVVSEAYALCGGLLVDPMVNSIYMLCVYSLFIITVQDDKLPDGGYLTMCGQLGPICPTLQPSDPKICDFAKCPIKKGDTFNVALSIPIDSHYPSV